MKYSAKVVGITNPVGIDTDTAEGLIAWAARRSSDRPKEEWGFNYDKLLRYCVRNKHWSVFEMCDVAMEVEEPRDMARQKLRHRSFNFQEFSQRYSDKFTFTTREIRRQDDKNRQNSIDDFTAEEKAEFKQDCIAAAEYAQSLYNKWRSREGAKECCRVFLPEGLTMSNLVMKGSVRSWLTFLEVREEVGVTQLEHVWVARACREAMKPYLPTILGLDIGGKK